MADVTVHTALVAAYIGVAKALVHDIAVAKFSLDAVVPTLSRNILAGYVVVATVLVVVARAPVYDIAAAVVPVSALAVTTTVVQTFDSAVVAVHASLFDEGYLADDGFHFVDVPAGPAGVNTVGTSAARGVARRL